jgi:hypothetical protein
VSEIEITKEDEAIELFRVGTIISVRFLGLGSSGKLLELTGHKHDSF